MKGAVTQQKTRKTSKLHGPAPMHRNTGSETRPTRRDCTQHILHCRMETMTTTIFQKENPNKTSSHKTCPTTEESKPTILDQHNRTRARTNRLHQMITVDSEDEAPAFSCARETRAIVQHSHTYCTFPFYAGDWKSHRGQKGKDQTSPQVTKKVSQRAVEDDVAVAMRWPGDLRIRAGVALA